MPSNMPSPQFRLSPQWWALISILVLLGGILAWNRNNAKQLMETHESDRLLAQTKVLNFIVAQNINTANSILIAQAREWTDNEESRATNQRLQALDSALVGMRSLLILDKNGISRAASRSELIGRDLSEREYYRFFKENPVRDTLFISPPFRSVLGTTVIVLARPIYDSTDVFRGVVAATMDPDFFAPLLKAARSTPDMLTAIAHGDGTLFLAEPGRVGSVLLNINEPGSIFRAHLENGKEISLLNGRLDSSGENGSWAISSVTPPDMLSTGSFVVIAGRNLDAIHMSWRRDSLALGLGYLVVAAASCFLMHFYMRRKRDFEQQLQKSAQALEEKVRFVRSVTDGIPGMVGYWDEKLRCQFANQAYLEWFGKNPEQLVGAAMQDVLGEELFQLNAPYIHAALWGEPQLFERTLTKADGSTGHTLCRYVPDKQGDKVLGFYVLVTDISELKQTQARLESLVEELHTLAASDGLTGLANRRRFWEQAKLELGRSRRYGFELCLVMLDIDKFKTINDGFGHAAGDEVLRRLAEVMKTALRETDVAGRLGGEEFGVLLPQTGETEAQIIAERLRQAVMATIVTYEGSSIRFTISLGLASAWKNENSVDDLMKRADMALYQAKETGRNRVCLAAEND